MVVLLGTRKKRTGKGEREREREREVVVYGKVKGLVDLIVKVLHGG